MRAELGERRARVRAGVAWAGNPRHPVRISYGGGQPGGHGEAIAWAMVKLALEPVTCCANARPDFLLNPDTGELLELDIWIAEHKLAVEFNGAQHYRPTTFASEEEVAKQQQRDAMKAALLEKNKIALAVLTAADLSVEAVRQKLEGLAPLRDLSLFQPLVSFLNRVGRNYQRKAQRLEAQGA